VSVVYPSTEDLLSLADDLGVLVIRDIGVLDSAAYRPQSTVFGGEAYASLHQKAAVLLESIVRNHPLIDGNKRLGWLALCVLYGLNGIHVDVADDDAYALIIALACGQLDYRDVATRLEAWLVNTT
jgi:death on curing protein